MVMATMMNDEPAEPEIAMPAAVPAVPPAVPAAPPALTTPANHLLTTAAPSPNISRVTFSNDVRLN